MAGKSPKIRKPTDYEPKLRLQPEDENRLVERLRGLPASHTLSQLAEACGFPAGQRDPRALADFLAGHNIVWRLQEDSAPCSQSARYVWLDSEYVLDNARAALKHEIAEARREMKNPAVPLYRKWV